MRKKRWIPLSDWLGIGLLLIGLLAGPPAVLMAQSPTTPADEAPTMEERITPEEEPARDPGGEGQAPQDRGGAYRRQKDNLKPFEPSEEIRVDKAVDFPADI